MTGQRITVKSAQDVQARPRADHLDQDTPRRQTRFVHFITNPFIADRRVQCRAVQARTPQFSSLAGQLAHTRTVQAKREQDHFRAHQFRTGHLRSAQGRTVRTQHNAVHGRAVQDRTVRPQQDCSAQADAFSFSTSPDSSVLPVPGHPISVRFRAEQGSTRTGTAEHRTPGHCQRRPLRPHLIPTRSEQGTANHRRPLRCRTSQEHRSTERPEQISTRTPAQCRSKQTAPLIPNQHIAPRAVPYSAEQRKHRALGHPTVFAVHPSTSVVQPRTVPVRTRHCSSPQHQYRTAHSVQRNSKRTSQARTAAVHGRSVNPSSHQEHRTPGQFPAGHHVQESALQANQLTPSTAAQFRSRTAKGSSETGSSETVHTKQTICVQDRSHSSSSEHCTAVQDSSTRTVHDSSRRTGQHREVTHGTTSRIGNIHQR